MNSLIEFPKTLNLPSLSPVLSGHEGIFRQNATPNQIEATNDKQAIEAWLSTIHNERTYEAYYREVTRLYHWAILVAKKPISSLSLLDYQDYQYFVQHLPMNWIGSRSVKRGTPRKMFVKNMSDKSTTYALTVISAMLAWLTSVHYLTASPLAGLKLQQPSRPKIESLSHEEIRYCFQVIENMPESGRHSIYYKARARWAFHLFLRLGLRINEVAKHNMGTFQQIYNNEKYQWQFHVRGKGRKKDDSPDVLPVTNDLMEELTIFRKVMVWDPPCPIDAEKEKLRPLFPQINGLRAMTPQLLRLVINKVFTQAADLLENDQPDSPGVNRLRAATVHWLRHTAITWVGAYCDIRVQKDFARHSDINTTLRYHHTETNQIYDAMVNIKY